MSEHAAPVELEFLLYLDQGHRRIGMLSNEFTRMRLDTFIAKTSRQGPEGMSQFYADVNFEWY